MNMFDRLAGTPCAGCVHQGWDLFYDEPALICTMKVRNRYGRWKCASAKCEKLGWEFYEREEWKAEKAEQWAADQQSASQQSAAGRQQSVKAEKKSGCVREETAAPAQY